MFQNNHHSDNQSFFELKKRIEGVLQMRTERFVDRGVLVGKITDAAVLFPLIIPKTIWESGKCEGMLTDHIYILLEKRSAKMNKNPGDMAFAGGKVDETDLDPRSTAFREAMEEIGIKTEELNFIAYMDEFVSTSKFIVRTVVCWLIIDIGEKDFRRDVEKKYKPLTNETENTVVIPLTHLLNPANYSNVKYDIKSELTNSRFGYIRYFDIDEFLNKTKIWGLTASMIRRFLDLIFPGNQLPTEEIK